MSALAARIAARRLADRCADTYETARCELPKDHEGTHRDGVVTWRFEDPWMPAWRRNLQAKDMTGRVAL